MKMEMTTAEYQNIIDTTSADIVVGVDRTGNEVSVLAARKGVTRETATNIFPVVVDEYEWSREEQIKRAQQFRDCIEYIYSPENDSTHPMLATWRLDDTARLKTTLALPFGGKVLETGCSSGTVTIEIAKLPQVREVVGIDLRPDAIATANELLHSLRAKGNISTADAQKVRFEVSAIEDVKTADGSYDSVCAFEVLEHLTIADFHKAMTNMLRLLLPEGAFLMSVPNRYPDQFYTDAKRARWNALDHKDYFSKESLEWLLKPYFKQVTFHSVDGRPVDKGVYLFAEGRGKK